MVLLNALNYGNLKNLCMRRDTVVQNSRHPITDTDI